SLRRTLMKKLKLVMIGNGRAWDRTLEERLKLGSKQGEITAVATRTEHHGGRIVEVAHGVGLRGSQ
ncbi:hypothetical protein B1218_38535, partial [Pseudomonas ogarae]